MNTRQYLEQVQDSDRKIQNKIQEEYRLRLLATSISSFSNGDKVQTSGGKDRVGDAVTRIVELQQEIASDVKELAELQMKVSGDINDMENSMYSSLLHKRYIEFKNLSRSQTRWDIPYSISVLAMEKLLKLCGNKSILKVNMF